MKTYMCLKYKLGAYNEVLEELLKLNIPRGDIFLLFGPFDILLQFTNLKNIDEFVNKWFNRIRIIGAEKSLIKKSLTFIVIHEGPKFVEEPFAFVFLNTQPHNLEKVQRKLLTLPKVISADTVFGPYDVICSVRADNRTDLRVILSLIQTNIQEIEGTMTTIVSGLRV